MSDTFADGMLAFVSFDNDADGKALNRVDLEFADMSIRPRGAVAEKETLT